MVDVHLNWLDWFHFLIVVGSLTVIVIDWVVYLSPFLRCYEDVYVNIFFVIQLHNGIISP